MKPITVVFFGRSGAGKGTQADLLLKYLAEKYPEHKAIYVETGQRFRDFQKSANYTAGKIKEVLDAGRFLPPFLPIWTWTGFLIDNFTGKEHLVFDGVCRQPEEGPILDSALQFYGIEKPVIILLDLHHEKARTRLIKRGRYDDKHEKIDERFKAFETGAMPSIRHFEKSPTCKFVTIDGDQTILEVFEDVKKALGI
jgi:adenylate kinase family enzyme